MALSTKKKNIISAMWKTGEFKSATAIAKHYKISTKTAQKIIAETTHENEVIVGLGVKYEMAKKSTKNPHEISTIEKVVQERVKASNQIYDLTNKNLTKVSEKLDKNTKKEKINTGDGMQRLEETELESSDYLNIQKTINEAGKAYGVIDASKNVINNTNAQQQNNEVTIEII